MTDQTRQIMQGVDDTLAVLEPTAFEERAIRRCLQGQDPSDPRPLIEATKDMAARSIEEAMIELSDALRLSSAHANRALGQMLSMWLLYALQNGTFTPADFQAAVTRHSARDRLRAA